MNGHTLYAVQPCDHRVENWSFLITSLISNNKPQDHWRLDVSAGSTGRDSDIIEHNPFNALDKMENIDIQMLCV